MYIAKAEKKGRTKREVNTIIRWLTGYSQKELNTGLKKETDFETFFKEAPGMNSSWNVTYIEKVKPSTLLEMQVSS